MLNGLELREKWIPIFNARHQDKSFRYLSFYTEVRKSGDKYDKVFVYCEDCCEGEWRPCTDVRKGKACLCCQGRKISQKENILRCEKAHSGSSFLYHETIYRGTDKKMRVICMKHGPFEILPGDHWKGIGGCFPCGYGMHTWEEFKEKANKVHKHKFIYPNQSYNTTRDEITIICPTHGPFKKISSMHLLGQDCWDCAQEAQRYTQVEFEDMSNKTHNNYYDYSKAKYITRDSIVTIICPIHNEFTQRAEDHYTGSGCSKCNTADGVYNITTMEKYKTKYQNTEGLLYLIKCWEDKEEFIKVGITKGTVKGRYNSIIKMPYKYKIIKEIAMNLYDAFYLEQKIKNSLCEYRHYPKQFFNGHTEALHIDCKELILSKLYEEHLTNPNK